MNTKTLLLLGGIGIIGWLIWKNRASAGIPIPIAAATSAAGAGTPTNLATATDQLQAQIAAGTYNPQALRMQANMPTAGIAGFRGHGR